MAAGCSRSEEARYQLNPKQPVMITVWNYYNGQTKQAFDNLVSRFNETVGMEMGIIVDSVSYGDVNQLAEEAYNSASGRLGADAMPNLFAAYPENAYRIDVLGKLVDLNQYFSEDELKVYRADFLQDCSFGGNYGLKILPVVRLRQPRPITSGRGARHFWALTAWPTTSLLRPCRQEMIFISCRTAR